MIVRKAHVNDLDQLICLTNELGYKVAAEKLKENLQLYSHSVWVAELDGNVVGYLAYHILDLFHSDERHMRIISLVAAQQYRRQGIGTKLLTFAEQAAKEHGCSCIELTSASHRMKNGVREFYCGQWFEYNGEKIYFRKKLSTDEKSISPASRSQT